MATIVQDYGPIYGEVVNGTVQGRPNGSVYVPLSNKIKITVDGADYIRIVISGGNYNLNPCNSTGSVVGPAVHTVAESQDLSSYMRKEVYSDSDLTTLIASANITAGNFNSSTWSMCPATSDTVIVNGDTYYCIAKLMNNGTPVATSEVVELTGWSS